MILILIQINTLFIASISFKINLRFYFTSYDFNEYLRRYRSFKIISQQNNDQARDDDVFGVKI